MDILYIEMKALHMMNKLHIFPPRLRLISLDFWVDTLLSKLCNLYFGLRLVERPNPLPPFVEFFTKSTQIIFENFPYET